MITLRCSFFLPYIEKIAQTMFGLSSINPSKLKSHSKFDPNDSIQSFEENGDHQVFSKDVGIPSGPPPAMTRTDALNQGNELGELNDTRMTGQPLMPKYDKKF